MPDGGVALIVDGAVGEVELLEEAPHIAVRPVEERVHANERGEATPLLLAKLAVARVGYNPGEHTVGVGPGQDQCENSRAPREETCARWRCSLDRRWGSRGGRTP